MEIEILERYKGSTWRMVLSEGETVFLNERIVHEFQLREGQSLPQSALEQVIRADSLRKARERALYLLDRRDYSYVEMFRKLAANYEESICYEVADALAAENLINDQRYAHTLARYFMETKKQGYYRAVQELTRRGIEKNMAQDAAAAFSDETQERLTELILQKYTRKLLQPNGAAKVKNALARLGYSYDEIRQALDAAAEELSGAADEDYDE